MMIYLRTAALATTLALAIPCAAWPQASSETTPPASVGGYLGAYFDNAYFRSVSLERPGLVLGVRMAGAVHPGLRIVGDLGFAQVDGVGTIGGTTTDYYVYDRHSILLTAGLSSSLPGRALAGFAADLRVGAGWLRIEQDRQVGQPPEEFDAHFRGGFTPHAIVAAGLGWRLPQAVPGDLELRVDDTVFLDEEYWSHSPSVGVLIWWP